MFYLDFYTILVHFHFTVPINLEALTSQTISLYFRRVHAKKRQNILFMRYTLATDFNHFVITNAKKMAYPYPQSAINTSITGVCFTEIALKSRRFYITVDFWSTVIMFTV